MNRIINLFLLVLVSLFFFFVIRYYLSDINVNKTNSNRSNIETLIKEKISNIPILENDTDNVIEFNSSFSEEIKDNKPRSFWNLFKKE
tara:strand:- start:272 stop:535 length:264 start_codon:yes stop_codon:yes gene_type:complete